MSESFDSEFLTLLAALNRSVAETGEPVEGNILYEHHESAFPDVAIAPRFAGKRMNLRAACAGRGRCLEIGVNAGHSALLMLYHNPQLHYVGVDICHHHYTQKAMDFLQQAFPGRVEFFIGDSLRVLPEIRVQRPDLRFDVVHIDGLHTLDHCKVDTFNALALSHSFAWIIIDDTDLNHIRQFYDELVANKILLHKTPDGWVEHYAHAIGMTFV